MAIVMAMTTLLYYFRGRDRIDVFSALSGEHIYAIAVAMAFTIVRILNKQMHPHGLVAKATIAIAIVVVIM